MNWPVVALGEVARVVGGATPRTGTREYWGGGIAWATPKDLSLLNAPTIARTERYITDAGLRSCAAEVLPPGSVLLSSRAPIGYVAINEIPMATNQGFKSLVPNDHLDAGYLAHWLRANRSYLESLGTGATFKEVSKAVVSRVMLPLPPLDEQRRIAAILDCAADLKRANARIESAVRELVSREFERRFPVGVSGRPFGAYVSDLVGGRNLVADDQAADAPFRVLKISAVTSGVFLEGESKPLPRSYSPPESHLVRSGDLLISRANTAELVGASALVVTDRTDLVLPDKLWRIVWREPDAIRPRYALALLQSQPVRRAMTRLASGTGGSMKNISKAKLLAMPISIAPLADQQRFEELADAASLHLTRTRARQRRLDTQMRTLPTRAFTGGL